MQGRETILLLTLWWLGSAARNLECTLHRKHYDTLTPTSAVAKAVQKRRTSQTLVVLGGGSQKQQLSRTYPRPEQGVWKLCVDGKQASC